MIWLQSVEIALTQGLLFFWAVLAFTVAFRLFGFPDLTVEASLPLGAATYAVMARAEAPLMASVSVACLSGAIAGAVTAYVNRRYGVNKFLAGVIVIAINYSLMIRIMGGSNVGLLGRPSLFSLVSFLDESRFLGMRAGTLLLLGVLAAVGAGAVIWFMRGWPGIRCRTVGSNPEFAKSVGLDPLPYTVLMLASTNALAAFSGVLLAMHQGFADVASGHGTLILVLAAMTLGESLLPRSKMRPFVFYVSAALVGSVAYQLIVETAYRLGLRPADVRLATGAIVLIVVALSLSKSRRPSANDLGTLSA